MQKKSSRGRKKNNLVKSLVVLALVLGGYLAAPEEWTEVSEISGSPAVSVETTAEEPTEEEPTEEPKLPDGSFEVHFIDVGQADAAVVFCDGESMLIDGGNVEDSNLLYTYLKRLDITYLDYVIGTHAHEDHIGGIAGALQVATVGTAYCPVTSYDSKAFTNFVKAVEKSGSTITIPEVGDEFSLGDAVCTILAVNTDDDDTNNTSIVMRIVYGNTSFMFTGDAERPVEEAILNQNMEVASTVLKVGHHGSDSSTSYVWLREVDPEYAVISVGKGNTYGHPTEEVLSRLKDAEVETYRTDMQGDIIMVSDGNKITVSVGRNGGADVLDAGTAQNGIVQPMETEPEETEPIVTEPAETEPTEVDYGKDYIVNTHTKKFHETTCRYVKEIEEKNRWDYHGTAEELISSDYEACKVCKP